MNEKQVTSRVRAVKAGMYEATGKLVGDKALKRKGAAHRKVLYEDPKENVRKHV